MARLTQKQRNELLAELPPLKRFCLTLCSSEADADDLLQATVERLLERGLPTDAHLLRWAYRVCRNLWIDEIRAREVRGRYAQKQATMPLETAPSAEQQSWAQRSVTSMHEAIGRLPEEQRIALVLVAVDGRSYAEAADILEVPIGTIMSRIARARKQLLDEQL